MSTEGETSNRLADALAQILSSRSTADDRPKESTDAPDDASQDVPDDVSGEAADEPYDLPEIVPATEDALPVVAPTLPARADVVPAPAPDRRDDAAAVVRAPSPSQAPTPTTPTRSSSPTAEIPAGTTPRTAWGDHLAPAPAVARGSGLRAPGRRPRVRRVTRVLRHIDPWSTFKVALLFSLVTYLVALTSGVLLWRVAESTGTVANVERWFTQFGWETFELEGGEIFHNAWIIGLFGVVGMTGGLVLLATVFNLVSDIIGGVRLTVLEEEVVERTITSTRRYVVRQGPAAAGAVAGSAPDWDVDDTDGEPEAGTGRERSARKAPDEPPPTEAPPTEAPPTADWSVD